MAADEKKKKVTITLMTVKKELTFVPRNSFKWRQQHISDASRTTSNHSSLKSFMIVKGSYLN